MDEKKLTEDAPRASDASTELRALAFLEDNQNTYFTALITLLARNLAATMTSINLQKNILAALGFGSKEEIEAHALRTYETWHTDILDHAESLIDELSRYEGLDEQNRENQ